jgi:uncharacterized protein YndB with AHSA1/START domain
VTEELTDEIFTLRVVHRAPRALVFAVMTTPEHLTHFWGPAGTHTPLTDIVVDLRPGGAFETTMISDRSGERHTMKAIYLEVRMPEYLSWREMSSGTVTELRFIDHGENDTEVITTQRGLPPAMRTSAARAGWRTALDRNAAYLASLVGRDPSA